jgi:hypothetical protein
VKTDDDRRLDAARDLVMRLLYIEPTNMATGDPVIDDLTLRMVRALRQATFHRYHGHGFHRCLYGALSDARERVLPNGWITNTLCVHYLAYHRSEVPAGHLAAVSELPLGIEIPTSDELHGPEEHGDDGKIIRPIDGPRERYDKIQGE